MKVKGALSFTFYDVAACGFDKPGAEPLTPRPRHENKN